MEVTLFWPLEMLTQIVTQHFCMTNAQRNAPICSKSLEVSHEDLQLL